MNENPLTIKCNTCKNYGDEPYNGQYDKRACYAHEGRRAYHIKKYGQSPDSYWMAPEQWVRVGSIKINGCDFFVNKEVISE